ncbi:MAG TPA: ATP-binding protein [Acidimicrobiia bacterium]|nr:ATP-binding protein [Acidimicrobiia bacterium]
MTAGPSVDRRSSRLLYDESGYLLTRHDERGRVGRASPAVEGLLGPAARLVEGRRWHDFVHPDDAVAFGRWWDGLRPGFSSTHTYRLSPRPIDGTVTTVETLARKFVVGTSPVIEVHALTHDVTAAADRTDDLVRAHDRLERRFDNLALRDQALTRFAAEAAHDLRAPLQAITGFAQLLARREGAALDETSQRFLAMIMGAAGDMSKLIDAALAHGQATAADAAFTSVDCATLLDRTILHIDTEIVRTGATIEIGDLPTVHAEPNQLSRVFQNLISNACKAALPARTTHVVVSAARLNGAWQFSVSDDGAGVAAEDRERIFELFKRGRDAERDGGVGIGLAICRTIVERHGGRIWVEDAPAGGSRFSFFLRDFDGGSPGAPFRY